MSETRVIEGLIKLGVLVFSLCFHEYGHAYAAYRLGDPTAKMLGRLTIDPRAHVDPIGTLLFPLLMIFYPIPLIGWAKPVPVTQENFKEPRRDMSLVAVAGPFMNILLSLLSIAVLWVFYHADFFHLEAGMQMSVMKLLGFFIIINFFLAVFNLIPIPPLDGGWLLKAILPGKWSYGLSRLEPYSIIVLIGLMYFGILQVFFIPAVLILSLVLNSVGLGDFAGMYGI